MAVASLFEDLLDQFRIEQQLAEKRYTDLYRAYDVDEDRPVRLDIVRPGIADDNGFVGRFTHRARAVAQVRHPNIAPLYHIGKTPDGLPYVAQAHVDGLPLAHRLEQLAQRATPVNTGYALKLVRQLADALVLAERLELFHYDLQPDNVWLKNVALPTDDSLLLLDLFVPADRRAIAAPEATTERAAYLSPEQRAGREITAASHVYSLGVLLYRLLAGRVPEGPVGQPEATWGRLLGRATSLERERPGLHPLTYALVYRCLRREPGRRFDSVEEFLAGLTAALAAEEATVGLGKAAPARWSLSWLLPILVLALILVAGAAAARGWRNQPPPADPVQAAAEPSATIFAVVVAPTDAVISSAAATPTLAEEPATVEATDPSPAPPTTEPTAAPATATDSPPPTVTPTPRAEPTQVPVVFVALNLVNLRRGPGLNFGLLGGVRNDEALTVLAWNNDAQSPWYLVATSDQRVGWISGQVVRSEDQATLAAAPVAATLPPTPFPTSTPPPTPTATPPIVLVTSTAEPGDDPGNPGGGGGGEEPSPTDEPAPTEPPEPTLTPPPLP